MKPKLAHCVICSCDAFVTVFGNTKSTCSNCGATVWITDEDGTIVPHVKQPKHYKVPEYLYSVEYSEE
jgi:hypothetical protein